MSNARAARRRAMHPAREERCKATADTNTPRSRAYHNRTNTEKIEAAHKRRQRRGLRRIVEMSRGGWHR